MLEPLTDITLFYAQALAYYISRKLYFPFTHLFGLIFAKGLEKVKS